MTNILAGLGGRIRRSAEPSWHSVVRFFEPDVGLSSKHWDPAKVRFSRKYARGPFAILNDLALSATPVASPR